LNAESDEVNALVNELATRNHRIASAVGACDCWGEWSDCRICDGQGRPGWTLPERSSFDVVVRPALRKLSMYRAAVPRGRGR
jgi:hypothetical protein